MIENNGLNLLVRFSYGKLGNMEKIEIHPQRFQQFVIDNSGPNLLILFYYVIISKEREWEKK